MEIKQCFVMAIRNLLVNRLRFLHAMLGMVIGIAAAVFVLGISSFLLNVNAEEEETYAEGTINAFIHNNADLTRKITVEDLEMAVADNPEVLKGVSPYVMFDLTGGVSYEGQSREETYIVGVGVDYFAMLPRLHLQEGRFLNDMDITRERKSCVIGSTIAEDLLGGEALGKTLRIWGENFEVVGVAANEDADVYIPYPIARSMVGYEIRHNGTEYTYYQDQYFVWAQSSEVIYDAMLVIEEMCEKVSGREKGAAWRFYGTSFAGIVEIMSSTIKGSVLQYLVFAGIIVLVGGVGIMNVMLASVQARTREIGIRKAFGATNRDIQRQFRLEAVITSLIGGLLGLLVGFGGLALVAMYKPALAITGGVSYPVDLQYMNLTTVGIPALLAFGVSVGIGIMFGDYPAKQAAKLEIVEALNEG